MAHVSEHRERFEEVYASFSGLILAFAARRTNGLDDATDVVAETFAIAWRRVDDLPDGEAVRPWLYAVARRVLANNRRSARRRARLDTKLAGTRPLNDVRGADDRDLDSPDLQAIAAALDALRSADREILTLMAWDGLSRQDLPVVLGCTAATARVRLHRARARFARELETGPQRALPLGHERHRRAFALPDPEETS